MLKQPTPLIQQAANILDILWRGYDTKFLLMYCFLTTSFMFLELGYGSNINSLGLISDAFHTGFHSIALMISLVSLALSRRQGTALTYSYGYDRHEVLSTFANSSFLVFVALFLIVEGFHRAMEPEVTLNGVI